MLLLFWIIALKCNMKNAILDAKIYNNLFTLAERFRLYLSYFAKTDFQDAAVNVIIFVPLGMMMPFLIQKCAFFKTAFYCFLISAGFEVLQIISCIGAFTYIDMIHNTAGGILGAIIYLLLYKKIKEKPLAIAFVILILLLIPTLIAAGMNTVAHIDYYL
jgi:glycopeptide antibiotics resistance protein